MRMKKARYLTNVFVLVLMVIFLGFVIFNLYENKRKSADYLAYRDELFHTSINNILGTYEEFSRFIFDTAINSESVCSIVAKAGAADEDTKAELRSSLYEDLYDLYEQTQNYNFRQLHFHLSDGESFLRFHSPENFGDPLFPVRESVRIANEEKRFVSGFEEGRIMNGYRFVYPLFYQNEPIGSVEISVSVGSVIQELNDSALRRDVGFILDKTLVESTVFSEEQERYTTSDVSEDYVYDKEVFALIGDSENSLRLYEDDAFTQRLKTEIAGYLANKESFSLSLTHNNRAYLIQYDLICDISGYPAGYLFSISENSFIRDLRTERIFILCFSAFILGVMVLMFFLLAKKQKEVRDYAMLDQLTRIFNRTSFYEFAAKADARQKRTNGSMAIAMLDIDFFKKVNDTYGHAVGDLTLKALADAVKSSIRETDVFARFGGEEFILLMPDTGLKAAETVLERIRLKIEQHPFQKVEKVTVSAGVTDKTERETIDTAIIRADKALYQSKTDGRNRVTAIAASDASVQED